MGLLGNKKFKLTKIDVFIIFTVTFIAVIVNLIFNLFIYKGNVTGVLIEVDGKKYAEYKFLSNNYKNTVEIYSENGYNVLCIENYSAKMIDASCKDKLDVLAGAINKPNQVLVCMPNKVVVRLLGKDSVDSVTY